MSLPPERIKHVHLGPSLHESHGSTDREYGEYWYVRGDVHEKALTERVECKNELRLLKLEMDALLIKVGRTLLADK